ncbi:hypothetical protein ACOSQ3_027649 [Xanthoceras sorbifolium]
MDPDEIEKRCAKLSLSDEDGPVGVIEDSLQDKVMQELALCLVGKIIANRDINREAFKSTISVIWRTVRDFSINSIGLILYMFRFKCPWDRKHVFRRRALVL